MVFCVALWLERRPRAADSCLGTVLGSRSEDTCSEKQISKTGGCRQRPYFLVVCGVRAAFGLQARAVLLKYCLEYCTYAFDGCHTAQVAQTRTRDLLSGNVRNGFFLLLLFRLFHRSTPLRFSRILPCARGETRKRSIFDPLWRKTKMALSVFKNDSGSFFLFVWFVFGLCVTARFGNLGERKRREERGNKTALLAGSTSCVS